MGFLYILGSIFFYINSKRAGFLQRIKRSYRLDYDNSVQGLHGNSSRYSRQPFFSERFSKWLERNGVEVNPGMFLTLMLLFISGVFVLCLFLNGGIFIFFAVSVIALFIFYIFVDLKGRKINAVKEAQMETFLIDLSGYLYTNPNILSCIEKAAEDTEQPLKKEFMAVVEDTRKGMRINESLERLVERSRSRIIQVIITGLIAANDKGVNLVDFLKDQIDYLREKKSIENYIRILSSGPRYTSYIIAVIPFIAIIAAAFLNRDFAPSLIIGAGPFILLYAGISYLAGFILINRVINFSDKTDRTIN